LCPLSLSLSLWFLFLMLFFMFEDPGHEVKKTRKETKKCRKKKLKENT
jgi:hypothetical protein